MIREGGVATVALDRPDVRNAMNPAMIGDLRDAVDALNADPKIRVIVLSGNGPAFCAGGDLNWMRDVLGQSEDEVAADSRLLLDMYRALNESPKTVIARVHGAAYAGALGLICCSDLAIARADTGFCVSEVRIGLVAGIISAFLLPRIGAGWFRYLATSAVPFDAATARDAGLVHVVAEDDAALDAAVAKHVALALAASPDAVAETGRMIADMGYGPSEEMFSTGLKYNAKARLSAAAQEGISAFLEKRPPSWTDKG